MEVNDLPLLELFTKLREAGLPLGIEEYQLVLQAMQAGFGINDQAALKRLCQTLWIKSAEEMQLFEYQFEQVMGSKAVSPMSQILVIQSQQSKISQIADSTVLGIFGIAFVLVFAFSLQKPINTQNSPSPQPSVTPKPSVTAQPNGTQSIKEIQPDFVAWSVLSIMRLSFVYICLRTAAQFKVEKKFTGHRTSLAKRTPSSVASSLPAKLTQTIEDEVQVAQVVLQATSRSEEIAYRRFIFNTEYFPVTERQMKQIWRYLRRPVREGLQTELDVEATVNQIGRQGLLLEPVLLPRLVNRAELLLLIDQDGSMVPFHELSRRLAETAWRGGRLGKAGIYYFHNCPVEYLYHDPNHQETELVSDIITHVCSNRTALLIFSDGGAARGGYSEERYELTKKFLAQLQQKVRYIVWLNPMPKKRWLGTTSGEIARLVPMFEVNRRGLQDAISLLRGRPTNFEGRRI